jgi:allantoin racemase
VECIKIRIILPIVLERVRYDQQEYLEEIRRLSGVCPSTELDSVSIERGPASIESRYDEILATPHVVRKILEAEREDVDAVVINCFGDPAVRAGRELVSIPVVGPGESSVQVASALCNRFSIITVLKSIVPLIHENVNIYGLSGKIASVRAIDIPVLELHKDDQKTVKALAEEGRKAIEIDRAEVLILGCTGMTGMAEHLREMLKVKVVDPLPTAVKFAETLVNLGLSHSKITYPFPPEKKRTE